MTVFGPPLHQLDRDRLQEFLNGAENEPLLWEAKGTRLDKHDIRKNACAFANGTEAGYIVLGAEEKGSTWELPGWEFPDEPPTWVASVVEDGVRPVPRLDVVTLPGADDARRVAVVEVQPIATPPCFSRGTIYERVPGRSQVVKDPTRLADLYGRGQTAHQNAGLAASGAADALLGEARAEYGEEPTCLALAVNATGHPPDISSRLFSEAYERSLINAVRDCLVPVLGSMPPSFQPQITQGFSQSARWATSRDQHQHVHLRAWHARVLWNGTAVVQYMTGSDIVRPQELAEGAIPDAWKCAARLLEDLGGNGSSYMELRVAGGEALKARSGAALNASLGRGPMDFPPTDEDLASVHRELRRAAGEFAYEDPPEGWLPAG